MDRRDFIQRGAALTVATGALVLSNDVFGAPFLVTGLDKLVNEKGEYVLAPLPYDFNALEPYMDAETVNLHYTFHHGGAVKALNKDQAKIKEALDKNDLEVVDYWVKKSAFHGSSHVLHSIFWTNLTGKGATAPKGELLKRIHASYGSFDKFKALIAQVSKNVDGNGWGILAYQPITDQLIVLQCENHEKLTQWGAIPLLVIDAWEHAYYLKYKNKRADFVDAIFQIIDWDNVALRLDHALKAR